MIEIKIDKKKKLFHFICKGKITHEDYQQVLIPTIEKEVNSNGPFHAFCDVRDMKSMQFRAIWDDYKFGIHHLKDFDRIATVGDQWWMGFLMKISQPLLKIKLKHFKGAHYKEAWEWVQKK